MSGTLEGATAGAAHPLDTRSIEPVMRRALELADRGPAWAENPQVGCVIVSPDGRVLAEGWHRGAGTPHAEVDALAQLTGAEAHGATAVVTLEPCNHTGRTGPCSRALIEAGIARVAYALSDPNPEAAGGAETLRTAGIEVIGGLLADEAERRLHGWLTAIRTGRPFVTVKWASTLDGRAAAADGTSQWITGAEARADVHTRRAAAGAIVAGTGTVLADDPRLTSRGDDGLLLEQQPQPVVLGRRAIPEGAAVRAHPSGILQYDGRDLPDHLADLWNRGIRSVFVEGGPTIASAFLAAGLADELVIYQAPLLLGGAELAVGDLGITTLADAIRLRIVSVDLLGDDVRIVARPRIERN
ncbi:MAG: bifunctional diaminohydroxyphosphoribosylaminopyrimidine deaminase/5-amino-6-(5-phosphoribosylamino)uracil reductase RibD [Naasia sp.]